MKHLWKTWPGSLLIGFVLFLPLCLLVCHPLQAAEREEIRLLKLKAAFSYRFILFTKWPEHAAVGSENLIHVGVIDNNQFADLFEQLAQRKGAPVQLKVHRFTTGTPLNELRQCQLLYFSQTTGPKGPAMIKAIADHPVLTISDMENFVAQGGMIGLFEHKNHLHFSVNRKAASLAGISFSARMLKMAYSIIGENNDR